MNLFLTQFFSKAQNVFLSPSCRAAAPLPNDEALGLGILYQNAFFMRYLKDDGRYQRFLTQGYAQKNGLPLTYYTNENASKVTLDEEKNEDLFSDITAAVADMIE